MEYENPRIPYHVAIILDGNGRWAAARGKARSAGHQAGADNVRTITNALIDRGVKMMTAYAFSTENWKRSEKEVSFLMALLRQYILRFRDEALERGFRVKMIGDRAALSDDLRALIEKVEKETEHLGNFTFQLAISYGGRDEITRAAKKLACEAAAGKLDPETITEESFDKALDTEGQCPPDLLIRTGGDLRISNFLLWQLAYAEFWFTPKYWPDFTVDDLDEALRDYAGRERRFGGRKDEE